jgi:glycosyltransferase involved in cell wall biosynthesis
MKLVLATPIYPPEIGGPATYTKELCGRLAGEHDITVVTYSDSKEATVRTKLVTVSKKKSLILRLMAYTLALWREAKKADLIYVQNAMAAGLPTSLVSLLTGIPFVLKFVGDEAWERASAHKMTAKRLEEFLESPEGNWRIKLMLRIQRFVLRRARIVTTPSIYLGNVIKKRYGFRSDRLVVNYNAAEEPEVLPFKGERRKNQIVTTGRLVPWKGLDGLLQAVALLKKEIPDIKLVVAGDGPEFDNLKNLSRKLHVVDNVVFLGRVSRAETWKLRNDSEIYVLNSLYEGLPHTVLTSFAAKIPVIATNIMGTSEAVYNEKTGLLVEPGDYKGLASAIKLLLGDTALQQKLVGGGSKLLEEKFSWASHLQTLGEILQTAISKPEN